MSQPAHDRWADALLAAKALAADPAGLGGAVIRARAGPARERWLAAFLEMLPPGTPHRRLPPEIGDERLLGGLDLAETLAAGRPVARAGVLEEARGGVVILPMAERCAPGLAGRLAAALDRGGVGVIALDERAEAGEAVPEALADRLALHVDLEGLALSDLEAPLDDATPDGVTPATEDAIEALTHTAAALAIPSLRAPMLALRVARALAGGAPSEADIATAARLVLAPRAEAVPAPPEDSDPPPPPPEPQENPGEAPESEGSGALEDRVLDAVRAILPADLIAEAADRARGQARAGEAGATREAPRGRPAGTRRAPQGTPQRLDVIATLRAAAPWQALRRRSTPGRRGTIVLAEDFRTKRHIRPAESVMIFLVDASGSAAAARLAEAKGAVEILLSRAYQRREKVALIAFRRDRAELLLPATRSLVQAKRRLATLPGGGGTPLAAGLMAGVALALQMRGRGITPHLTILTDGRGNVALDGTSDRGAAAEDTARAARAIRAEGLTATLIDTSNRPQQAAQELARTMGARYLALPRADAAGLATRLAPA